ncbi:MAG: riboflavin biosynthesis protein RibF [Clostridia bacterium]|nr:riboflavin biosynthesis protein RibF [Clostridia bacterium]
MSDKLKKPTVLALGYFDSVHLGHRKVIETAKRYAIEHGATLTVLTFGGNLRAMLSCGDDKVVYLAKEREGLLKQLGVDDIYFAPVDFSFLSMGKLAFLNKINRKYNVICYVCGEDYRFGKFGKGDVNDIKRYAEEKNQHYIITETELYEGKKISTSYIKRLLTMGSIEKANELLVNPYFVTGKVCDGRRVGRDLGFPTLNLNIHKEKHRLRDAVYAGHAYIDGVKYTAIMNYGPRPTFDLNDKIIEAHILDFNGDLYGKEVMLCFDAYIREIQKFSGMEDLKNQLKKDLEKIKGIGND